MTRWRRRRFCRCWSSEAGIPASARGLILARVWRRVSRGTGEVDFAFGVCYNGVNRRQKGGEKKENGKIKMTKTTIGLLALLAAAAIFVGGVYADVAGTIHTAYNKNAECLRAQTELNVASGEYKLDGFDERSFALSAAAVQCGVHDNNPCDKYESALMFSLCDNMYRSIQSVRRGD